MKTGLSASFCLIVCFLVCSSETQTNIGAENITAEVGKNATLPCKAPINNINITAVKWNRPDQEPEYVLLYRDGRLDPDYQHPSYQNRTNLQDQDMKDGDFSMILKNLMMKDTGRYKCWVYQRKNCELISNIYLEVYPSAQKIIRPENITAEVGQDVILPCKAPNNINIRAVVWSRLHEDPEYVLFYRDGCSVPHNQHPSYQNRVDLQDKDMKDGNVSLILKNVMMEDSGRYKCLVFEEGKVDPISIIYLEVHGKKVGNTGDGGDKTGIIAGSVVGVILLLAVVSVGFRIYRRYRRKNPLLRDIHHAGFQTSISSNLSLCN